MVLSLLEVNELLHINKTEHALSAAIGDGVADDTDTFNAALAALKVGEVLTVPTPLVAYKITSELVEPTVKYWGMCGNTGAHPLFDVSALSSSESLIAITQRGATLANLSIEGNILAPNHTYTPIGIKVGNGIATSNFALHKLRIRGCSTAIEFDNAQDSTQVSELELYNNHTDIKFKGNVCTSVRMSNVQMLESEYCIKQEISTANLVLENSTLAARPFSDTVNPVSFDHAMYKGHIRGCRFEHKDHNNLGKVWHSIYIKGFDTTYPTQSLVIDNNYFSGTIDDSIHVAAYARWLAIDDNIFKNAPAGVDIRFATETVKDVSENRNSTQAVDNRSVSVFSATGVTTWV